jgi:hypothetical protein
VPAAAGTTTGAASRLAGLARAGRTTRAQAAPRCELCGAPLGEDHRHVLDLAARELKCTCRPCALLFDDPQAARGRVRAVGDRRLRLDDFALDDALWAELQLPVDMVFFFRDTAADRVSAFYPSPMGATESLLTLSAWTALEDANPVLATLVPDVEALLVTRARGARRQWIVPIDDCFALVGLIRTRWRGLTGGAEVWRELDRFFDDLDGRARPHRREAGG